MRLYDSNSSAKVAPLAHLLILCWYVWPLDLIAMWGGSTVLHDKQKTCMRRLDTARIMMTSSTPPDQPTPRVDVHKRHGYREH